MNNKQGFTLVELMVAAYILLVGICGVFLLYVRTMHSAESSWDSTVAASHIQSIFEEMQNKNNLTDVMLVNWDAWAQNKNLKTLPGEAIGVGYSDPPANPLYIKVEINWRRADGIHKMAMETALTR